MQLQVANENLNNTRFVKDNERNLFFNFFSDKNRIAIISHIDPDGDAISSVASIYFICCLSFIHAKIFLFNKPPYQEYNLWNIELLQMDEFNQNNFEGVIFVDTPSLDRSGLNKKIQLKIPSLCIDHHVDNKYFCDFNIVAPKFCSTSEIIYDIIENSDFIKNKSELPENKDLINYLYESLLMGILFDTYYFQTENVDHNLLQRTSILQEKTNAIHKLKNVLFKNQNPMIYKFWGNILSTISLYHDDQIVIAKANNELFKDYEKKYQEFSPVIATEGFINHLMSLRNVSIAIFIRELDNVIKVSIRSSIKVASILANHFGGGGHENASAFKLSRNRYSSIDELEKDILKVIERDNLLN